MIFPSLWRTALDERPEACWGDIYQPTGLLNPTNPLDVVLGQ